jgi:hypothetical protein
MVVQQKQWLLRLLPLRIIVNGTDIYPLKAGRPVLISVLTNPVKITITNGFHYSQPVMLNTYVQEKYALTAGCLVDNFRLGYSIFLLFFLFGMYWITGMRLFQIVANLPILYMLYLLYFRRRQFIFLGMATGAE